MSVSHPATDPTLIPPTPGSLPLAEVLRRLDERPVASAVVSVPELMARIEARRRALTRASRS